MNILFIHQNFPGQFKFLAPALAAKGHHVLALHMRKGLDAREWKGVRLTRHQPVRGSTPGIHPWITDFETKTIRAESCFRTAIKLKEKGFTPDIIVAHHGWGESLFLMEVWPQANLGIYCEFYYNHDKEVTEFDPEFPPKDPVGDACRLQLKNLTNLLHFQFAKAGLSPTHWQASTFPEPFRSKITVIHDGIDTNDVAPKLDVSLQIQTGSGAEISISNEDEIITFVNRNLEPYRGYHHFMRALPELLKRRPNARILIVGGDDVSYGGKPDPAKYGNRSWKQIFIEEVQPQIESADWERVHFLGKIPHPSFVQMLQLSTVHVYLTYPFVLSWSLLEAMSAGCAIVASDTQPLKEAIRHDDTGRLVDFFDNAALVEEVCQLLDDGEARDRLGKSARAFAQKHYDLESVCLAGQIAWVENLGNDVTNN